MHLIDTNIFLEILLKQEKKETCKEFLEKNKSNLYISDFSLHSIGVILFKNKKEDSFLKFLNDLFLGKRSTIYVSIKSGFLALFYLDCMAAVL